MELAGKVAVVTGAASGIGRALARRFVAEGARGVTLADVDADRVRAAAAELGAGARASVCDVADGEQLQRLLDESEAAFGPIDVFCANAGIAIGSDLDTPEHIWIEVMNVNVAAHVRAARLLVPKWVERGGGHFLVTASAAGLLTQIGAAPYSVSKHAAVAFAEWLAIAYGDRGVQVTCVCPMLVDTPMLRDAVGSGVSEEAIAALSDVIDPDEVAEAAVSGLRDERFLVLPHPGVHTHIRRRANDHDRWLAGMRRLRAGIES